MNCYLQSCSSEMVSDMTDADARDDVYVSPPVAAFL